ncbi:restriction endonuclease [Streptomyces sp. NPDC012769]|uniref:restriction endonuclease n=1 Tax=Streptomyces sp. NPDC012769 TaxID=3364848 RepID=UPI0036A8B1C5
MTAVGGEGSGTGKGSRVRVGRDVVLVVGLVGAVVGGSVLLLKTAQAAGAGAPVTPLALLAVLGLGVVMARWSIAPTRGRLRPRADAVRGRRGLRRRPAPPPAEPLSVDAEALDHASVDPEGFEHSVAALCARDGCTVVEVVGGAGDLGADVVATTADGRKVVLQCKQYTGDHRVGSPDLQRFGGTCFTVHEADVAVLVTTGTFTEPALDYAAACGILCVDGPALAAWTESAAPAPWDSAAVPGPSAPESGAPEAPDPAGAGG